VKVKPFFLIALPNFYESSSSRSRRGYLFVPRISSDSAPSTKFSRGCFLRFVTSLLSSKSSFLAVKLFFLLKFFLSSNASNSSSIDAFF
jgi:hypothetical protein